MRPPASRRRPGHRRRARRAGRPAGPRPAAQLQRRDARGAGHAGRRARRCAPTRVGDTEEATRAAIGAALEEADVLVLSGGVSVGPHDHVKPALAGPRRRRGLLARRAAPRARRPGSARAATRSSSACPATRSPRWSPSCSSPARRSGRCRARPHEPERIVSHLDAAIPRHPDRDECVRVTLARRLRDADRAAGLAPAHLDARRRRLRDRHRRRRLGAARRPGRRRARLAQALDVGQHAVGQRRERGRRLLHGQRAVGQQLLEPAAVGGVDVAGQPRGRLRRAARRAADRWSRSPRSGDRGPPGPRARSRRAAPRPAGTPRSRARRR